MAQVSRHQPRPGPAPAAAAAASAAGEDEDRSGGTPAVSAPASEPGLVLAADGSGGCGAKHQVRKG